MPATWLPAVGSHLPRWKRLELIESSRAFPTAILRFARNYSLLQQLLYGTHDLLRIEVA